MRPEEILKRHQEQLESLPFVTGTGLSERDGKPVIVVFIDKNVSDLSQHPSVIPETLEGLKVIVAHAVRVLPGA